MSETLHQIQEFFLGALKKDLLEDNSVKAFLYSIFGVLSADDDETLEACLDKDLSDETSLTGKSLITLRKIIDLPHFDVRVIPVTVQFVESAIGGWSPGPRRGACLVIAVVASTERANTQCLNRLLAHLAVGIKDYHPAVRSAALFALHRFFFNIKVSLKLHADILQAPIFECLTMLCNPPKSPASLPKIPDYIGTLFETAILLCGADDGNVNIDMFISFLPKLIQYLLLASRYNAEFRQRGADIILEVAQSTESESLSNVSETIKSIETCLESRPSNELPNKLAELWEIFRSLEKDLQQEQFNSVASKCLTLVMAAIRMVLADRVSLRWAYDLLPKLKFFLKPKLKEAVEQIVDRQYASVVRMDATSKVENAVNRIVRKQRINFVWLKTQKKKQPHNGISMEGNPEVSNDSKGNASEENGNKIIAKEVMSMGNAFKPIVCVESWLNGSMEAPERMAINPVKPSCKDEDKHSPAANVQKFQDMFALSPEAVPTITETSSSRIPSPPPPPTIALVRPLCPPPAPPSPLYSSVASSSECRTPSSRSHTPSSKTRTPSSRSITPSSSSRTHSRRSCTPSRGSRTPASEPYTSSCHPRAPSCTSADRVPVCLSLPRPSPSVSPSSLVAMWSSPSPPNQLPQPCPPLQVSKPFPRSVQPLKPCPPPIQLAQPCPPPPPIQLSRLCPPPEPLDPLCPTRLPTPLGQSVKHCSQKSPADERARRSSNGNSAPGNTETRTSGSGNLKPARLRNIVKEEVFTDEEEGDLNIDEAALEGLQALEDFQSDCNGLLHSETEKNEGKAVAPESQDYGTASHRFEPNSNTDRTSADSNGDLVKEEPLCGSFHIKEEPLDTNVEEQLGGNTSQSRAPEAGLSEWRKSNESGTQAKHSMVTISLPVIKTEPSQSSPTEADSNMPGGSNKRVLRSSTQKTAGGDFLPIPSDFPPALSAHPLTASSVSSNIILGASSSISHTFLAGAKAKLKTYTRQKSVVVPTASANTNSMTSDLNQSQGEKLNQITTTSDVGVVLSESQIMNRRKWAHKRQRERQRNKMLNKESRSDDSCLGALTGHDTPNTAVAPVYDDIRKAAASASVNCVNKENVIRCVNTTTRREVPDETSTRNAVLSVSASAPSSELTRQLSPDVVSFASMTQDEPLNLTTKKQSVPSVLPSDNATTQVLTSTDVPTRVPTSTDAPTRVPTSTDAPTLVPTSTDAPTQVRTSTDAPTSTYYAPTRVPTSEIPRVSPSMQRRISKMVISTQETLSSFLTNVLSSSLTPKTDHSDETKLDVTRQEVTVNAIPRASTPISGDGLVKAEATRSLFPCLDNSTLESEKNEKVGPSASITNVSQHTFVRPHATAQKVAPSAMPCANEPLAPNTVENVCAPAQQVAPMPCASASALAPNSIQRMSASTQQTEVTLIASCSNKPTLNVPPNTAQCVNAKTQKVAPYLRPFGDSSKLMAPDAPPLVSRITSPVSGRGQGTSQVKMMEKRDRIEKQGSDTEEDRKVDKRNHASSSKPGTVIAISSNEESRRKTPQVEKSRNVEKSNSSPKSRPNSKKKSNSNREFKRGLVSYSSSDSFASSSESESRKASVSRKDGSGKRQCTCGRDLKQRCSRSPSRNSRKRSRSSSSSRSRCKRNPRSSSSRRRYKRSSSSSSSSSRDRYKRSPSSSSSRGLRKHSRSSSDSRSRCKRSHSSSRRRSKKKSCKSVGPNSSASTKDEDKHSRNRSSSSSSEHSELLRQTVSVRPHSSQDLSSFRGSRSEISPIKESGPPSWDHRDIPGGSRGRGSKANIGRIDTSRKTKHSLLLRKQRESDLAEGKVVFVGHIPDQVSKYDLVEYFEPFGPIVRVESFFGKNSNRYGLITYACSSAAASVVERRKDDIFRAFSISLGQSRRLY